MIIKLFKKLTTAFLHILIFFIISCEHKADSSQERNEVETKTDEQKNEEIEKFERHQTLKAISEKYGASAIIDTSRFKMTYQYQNLIKQNDKVIIDRYRITDIEKIDSIYNVSIEKGLDRKMLIEFTCNERQLETIFPKFSGSEEIEIGKYDNFLILRFINIKKMKLKIDSYGEDNNEDEPFTFVEIDASESFLCRAELVDIYLKPKK
jgi:hypothetical protein